MPIDTILCLWAYFCICEIKDKYSNLIPIMKNNIKQTYQLLNEWQGIREPLCEFDDLVNCVWKYIENFKKNPKTIKTPSDIYDKSKMLYICDFKFDGKYRPVYLINDSNNFAEGMICGQSHILINAYHIQDIYNLREILKHEIRHYHDDLTTNYLHHLENDKFSGNGKALVYLLSKTELNAYLESAHQNFLRIIQQNKDKQKDWFLEKIKTEQNFIIPRIISLESTTLEYYQIFGLIKTFDNFRKIAKGISDDKTALMLFLFQFYVDFYQNVKNQEKVHFLYTEETDEFKRFCKILKVETLEGEIDKDFVRHLFSQRLVENIYNKMIKYLKRWLKHSFTLAKEEVEKFEKEKSEK